MQSVLADQTGVLNRIRPYTGLSTDLDIRHALATLPLWIAYVARMTGIHATIVAHTLLPLRNEDFNGRSASFRTHVRSPGSRLR